MDAMALTGMQPQDLKEENRFSLPYFLHVLPGSTSTDPAALAMSNRLPILFLPGLNTLNKCQIQYYNKLNILTNYNY